LIKKHAQGVGQQPTMAKKKTKTDSFTKLYQTILEHEIKQKKQQQIGTNMTLKSINNTNDETELRNWCHKYFSKTGQACFTDVLLNETGNQFAGYTKPSMQAVMRKVWNEIDAPKPTNATKKGGKKRVSPVSVMSAPNLTAIARSGAQLKDDHEDGVGDEEGMFNIIACDDLLSFELLLMLLFTGTMMESEIKRRRLVDSFQTIVSYGDDEVSFKTWVNVFQWDFMADGSGEVQEFVSADVGSDGLGKPTAQVVDNGRVLEIMAEIKDNRHKTTDCYDKAITEHKTILKAAVAGSVEEIEAEKKIDMLKARRTAHAKYMKTMKSEIQANWSRQVFRIPLPCEV